MRIIFAESLYRIRYYLITKLKISLYGKKSRVSIVAVAPCEIYCISAKEIGLRMKSDIELYKVISETNVALFDTTYNRYIDLHKSAKERYDELIKKHKEIFSIFPLKDIASFLNITLRVCLLFKCVNN